MKKLMFCVVFALFCSCTDDWKKATAVRYMQSDEIPTLIDELQNLPPEDTVVRVEWKTDRGTPMSRFASMKKSSITTFPIEGKFRDAEPSYGTYLTTPVFVARK